VRAKELWGFPQCAARHIWYCEPGSFCLINRTNAPIRNPRPLPRPPNLLGRLFDYCGAAEGSRNKFVDGYEIGARLSGTCNDSKKQFDETSNHENLAVKYEDNV